MRILLGWMLGAFCMTLAPASAQTANPPFIVMISAEAPAANIAPDSYTVKAGSEVFIKVRLTNTSLQDLSIGVDSDSRTEVNFYHHYEVRDGSGNSAKKRAITHPEIGSTGHGWPDRIVKPGETLEIDSDRISRLYDLTQPGKYTIQLTRAVSGVPSNGEVSSKIIALAVTE